MNGNDTPSTLHAELLEKSGCHDLGGRSEGVWVKQGPANNTHDDDAEPSPEDGTGVPDNGATAYGTEIGDDLGDCDLIGSEVVLIGEHGGVQVLRAVRHEVEASHEEDHVGEEQPVLLERDFALLNEDLGCIGRFFSDALAF